MWVCPQDLKQLEPYTWNTRISIRTFQCVPHNKISILDDGQGYHCVLYLWKICKHRTLSKEPRMSYRCDGTYMVLYNSGEVYWALQDRLLVKKLDYQHPEFSNSIDLDGERLHNLPNNIQIVYHWKQAAKISQQSVKFMYGKEQLCITN